MNETFYRYVDLVRSEERNCVIFRKLSGSQKIDFPKF